MHKCILNSSPYYYLFGNYDLSQLLEEIKFKGKSCLTVTMVRTATLIIAYV
jgi:hypothetical protein